MEQFGETKKRTEAEGEQWRQTKRRRSGFLKENTEKENEFQVEELTLKKQHQQQEAARQGPILAKMQQQQQQTAAMMALIEITLPKKSDGSRSLPFGIVDVTLCRSFCVNWGLHLILSTQSSVQNLK